MELIEELKILENTYHNEEDLLIAKNSSSVLLINLSNDIIKVVNELNPIIYR